MKLKRLSLFFLTAVSLFASSTLPSQKVLKQQIGQMLIVGFEQNRVNESTQIVQDIQTYHLGGVILFDRFYHDKQKAKNIVNAQQLQTLTRTLQAYSPKPLIISIDQEGGKVQRLKEQDGFKTTHSAYDIRDFSLQEAKQSYRVLAQQLHFLGINTNFAPVVDLAINENNGVIYKLKRSYSKDPLVVASYAQSFIEALNEYGIIAVLKHFPGHGSSLEDSHKGFVDVSHTWNKTELEPYKKLIKKGGIQMIMTAHVFNEHLDENYPATLSYSVNTQLLRQTLGYEGVIISDDLQMDAILEHYNLEQTVTLAINSGVDLLLFGNQLAQTDVKTIIDTIYAQVLNKKIPYRHIQRSNERIEQLLKRIKK